MRIVLTSSLLVVFCLYFTPTFAAKYLLLQRLGKRGSIEFREGDYIRFKVKGSDTFNRSLILGFTKDAIRFNSYQVPLEEIEIIDISRKSFGGFQWSRLGFISMLSGGVFLVIDAINNEFTGKTAAISGGLVGGGLALTFLKKKKFKVGPRNKIEIIDL